MLRFATFKSAGAAIRYFVEDGAECARAEPHVLERAATGADAAVEYFSENGRVVGEWLGGGAEALGLSGPITADQVAVLEHLLSGRSPDGVARTGPVWRPHPDGRLPAMPLVDAVRGRAGELGMRVDQLLTSDTMRGSFAKLSGRVEREPGAVAHPQQLSDLATAAGLDLNGLYGAGTVAVAFAQPDTKVDERKAGMQGSVSAPKSASLLWALGDNHTGQEVLAAHRTAVKETVAYLERWAGHALRGHQGDGQRATQVGTDGLVIAAFDHHTSRADDPQLHTHLVIANLLHGEDGKWSALDTRAVIRIQRTAGYLYQAVLRGELTTRLGVAWGPVRNGMAEITGLPPSLLREFSTRREAIEARLRQTGQSGVKAAQVACLDTRPAKSGRSVAELFAGWWTRAQAHVNDPTAAVRGVLGQVSPLRLADVRLFAVQRWLLGPDGVTRQRTGFDRHELTRDLLETLPTGTALTAHDVVTVTDELLADPRVLPLIPDSYGTARFTTAELTETELDTLRLAVTRTCVPAVPVAPRRAERLSEEQTDAVGNIARSLSTVDVVLGPAGAGKTALLATLHEHYLRLDVPVVGACVAAIAARRLETATGVPATSVARLLHRIGRERLPERCVLVLDEAGMVGTRDYHRLLAAVTNAGGKLVAVGDRAQLTEIDAGGMFARLSRAHLVGELTDNHRQTNPWERDALLDLRHGRVERALAAYSVHDRVHQSGDHPQLVDHIAAQYEDALHGGARPFDVVALAASRHSATTLNTAIRTRLQHASLLGTDRDVAGRTLAVGELVVVTRNDHPRALLNGTRATITAISRRGLTLHLDDNRNVTVPAAWAAERLRPAYALTVHKAQGLTVDAAFVDTTGLRDRNAAYVAASRARHRTELHHTGLDPLLEAICDDPLTAVSRRPSGGLDARRRLASRVGAQREQQLAIDQAPQGRSFAPPQTTHDPLRRDVGMSR